MTTLIHDIQSAIEDNIQYEIRYLKQMENYLKQVLLENNSNIVFNIATPYALDSFDTNIYDCEITRIWIENDIIMVNVNAIYDNANYDTELSNLTKYDINELLSCIIEVIKEKK
jgi:hypothetical protein